MDEEKKELNTKRREEVDELLKDGQLTVCAVDELVNLRSLYVFLTNATQIFVLDRLNGSTQEVNYAIAGYYEISDWVNKRFDNLIDQVQSSEQSNGWLLRFQES